MHNLKNVHYLKIVFENEQIAKTEFENKHNVDVVFGNVQKNVQFKNKRVCMFFTPRKS